MCRSDPEAWEKTLGAKLLPGGSLRLPSGAQVSALPGYAEGAWWVQDAGATVAARVLNAEAGERVLDLCAAPGGKTMQLAATGAQVTALDVSQSRMARVADNLARTGLKAELVVADALKWEPDHSFDAVLLDAPCSATGTLRRHPDLGYARDGSGIAELVALQSALLDRAAGFLKPGGRLVYCTCSLLPEEGEEQIDAFLRRAPSFGLADIKSDDPAWPVPRGLRIRPDHWEQIGGIDGFFVACLENRP
jgi:16S rRNA (cytosine967-C5)-methyltransferase